MDGLRDRLLRNWQPKLTAIVGALVVWLLVNNSITTTRVVENVSVRVINIPAGQTVLGLQPHGTLRQQLTLTLTGSREILDRIEPGDLEVQIDASGQGSEWIAHVSRKNLVTTNPEIDISQGIDKVSHSEFIIKLSKLVTAKVPVRIRLPRGEAPRGYQFLDIWPQRLYHSVSGPEIEVTRLRRKGLELTFDLSDITGDELDELAETQEEGPDDEVRYIVPNSWKEVIIPFISDAPEELNDPEADKLHMDFLRRELLPVQREIPLRVFYALRGLERVNPESYSLKANNLVKLQQGIFTLNLPVYTRDVSRLFLDVCRDQLELVIIAPDDPSLSANWGVQFVDPRQLENEYIRRHFPRGGDSGGRESYLRNRFRSYMQRFELYKSFERKLNLKVHRQGDGIVLVDMTADLDAPPNGTNR